MDWEYWDERGWWATGTISETVDPGSTRCAGVHNGLFLHEITQHLDLYGRESICIIIFSLENGFSSLRKEEAGGAEKSKS